VIVWLYATPAVPLGSEAGDSVIAGHPGAEIVKIAEALAVDCPSGFVTVTVLPSVVAFDAMLMFNVTCVGSVYVTELTVMPLPLTDAEIWLANPAPGSKNPEPAVEVPEIEILTFVDPALAEEGDAPDGPDGGGARSLATRHPYEFVASQNC
jgi:hypothetical protein